MIINTEPVRIGDVDLGDRRYKVSRNAVSDEFSASVADLGVLDPVRLLEGKGGYAVLFGINRIEAAAASGRETVPAGICRSIDPGEYCRLCLLKALRNEIGPVGRVRALGILASIKWKDTARVRRHLGVPEEFFERPERLLSLPRGLADFLDCRDVGYRTIRLLLDLPDDATARVSRWVAETSMGVNLFKRGVELASEIVRRDGSLDSLDDTAALAGDDRKAAAERLMEEIGRRRYPRYTELRERAEAIKRKLAGMGFDVDFPKYFEGESFRVSVTVKRGAMPEEVKQTMESLPPDLVAELQRML